MFFKLLNACQQRNFSLSKLQGSKKWHMFRMTHLISPTHLQTVLLYLDPLSPQIPEETREIP